MSDRLFLRLAPDGSLSWLRAGGVQAQAGAPPAAVLAAAREVVVLVPGSEVLLTRASLTARNRAQLLKAVPYAVEDLLLAPVESLHFAATAAHDGHVGVAVVARDTLARWLDGLGAAGIEADVLVPDTLAVPVDDGQPTLLVEADRASLRLAPWATLSCSLGELPGLLAQIESLPPLHVLDCRHAPRLALPCTVVAYAERAGDALALLAAQARALPLNLLDGEFAARRRRRHDGARWWRVAAGLAAAVVLLAFGTLGAQVWQLARTSAQLDQDARAAVLAALPDLDARVFDRLTPAQLVQSRLGRGADGAAHARGVLALLERIGPVLAGSPGQVQLRALDYRNGVLELALRAPDLNALDLVRERIAMLPGCKAELTAANPGADGVDGRIRIDATAEREARQ